LTDFSGICHSIVFSKKSGKILPFWSNCGCIGEREGGCYNERERKRERERERERVRERERAWASEGVNVCKRGRERERVCV